MPRLLISAAHKSSGKTTITLGLAAALRARGKSVLTFKKGPDYIDPMWLALASGKPCYNLDFWTMDPGEIKWLFSQKAAGSELAIIEGNKGLYDGMDLGGSDCNAALAKLLDTPVVLVIDAKGITRGIAPLVLGYRTFDPEVKIAGLILNKVSGKRHEDKLRAVLASYLDIPVLGVIARDERLLMVERHLGLVPSNEAEGASRLVEQIGSIIASQVDLEAIQKLAGSKSTEEAAKLLPGPTTPLTSGQAAVRIGVSRDSAFAFYYPDDLEALARAGAELVFFNTICDHLPPVDGLFLGGGFPEVQMQALERNVTLRAEIKAAAESGLPIYAECGGMMYLTRSLSWNGIRAEMVGVLPADAVMTDRPIGRGYVILRETAEHPWPLSNSVNSIDVPGHEFHYSRLENWDSTPRFAYRIQRGAGVDGRHDGIVYRNILACYSHQRDTNANPWATRFVQFVRDKKIGRPR